MNEVLGALFFAAIAFGIFLGLRILSRKRVSTEEEFEKNASESTSGLGASVRALQGMIDPAEGRAERVISEVREGRYNKEAESGEGPVPGLKKLDRPNE